MRQSHSLTARLVPIASAVLFILSSGPTAAQFALTRPIVPTPSPPTCAVDSMQYSMSSLTIGCPASQTQQPMPASPLCPTGYYQGGIVTSPGTFGSGCIPVKFVPAPVPPVCDGETQIYMGHGQFRCPSISEPLPCTVKSIQFQMGRMCELTMDQPVSSDPTKWGFDDPIPSKTGQPGGSMIDWSIPLVPVEPAYSTSAQPNGFNPTAPPQAASGAFVSGTSAAVSTSKVGVPAGLMLPSLYKEFVSEGGAPATVKAAPTQMPPTQGAGGSVDLQRSISLAPAGIAPAPRVIQPIRNSKYDTALE